MPTLYSGTVRAVKHVRKLAAVLLVAILCLNIVWVFVVYSACASLELTDAYVDDIDVVWSEGLVPKSIIIRLRLVVRNPTDIGLEIKETVCNVYIEDVYLGKAIGQGTYLPPHSQTPIDIVFLAHSSDIAQVLARVFNKLVSEGSNTVEYRVVGYLKIPLKLFGIIDIADVNIGFDYRGRHSIEPPTPQYKVKAWWEKTLVKVGERVYAYIEICGPAHGTLEVYIMEDIPLAPDRVALYGRAEIDIPAGECGRYYLEFIPKMASGEGIRGYYIKVVLNGRVVYEQEPNYPPRLTVVK